MIGASERAFRVAKQFTLNQLRRQSAAGHRQESRVSTRRTESGQYRRASVALQGACSADSAITLRIGRELGQDANLGAGRGRKRECAPISARGWGTRTVGGDHGRIRASGCISAPRLGLSSCVEMQVRQLDQNVRYWFQSSRSLGCSRFRPLC